MLTIPALLLMSVLQFGYLNSGGVVLTGPNNLRGFGAYEFRDLCDLAPQSNLKACYAFKVVLAEPLIGMPPDMAFDAEVRVWGTGAGHYCWSANGWTLEMIGIDEAVRQQVAWEGAGKGVIDAGLQHVNITVGSDVISVLVTVPR